MIIDMATALYLIDLHQAGRLRGRGLTLGKLDPAFTFEQLAGGMAARGMLSFSAGTASVTPHQKAVIERYQANGRFLSHKPGEAQRGFVSDEFFYQFIGLDEVQSVDHRLFEHADYAFDLNTIGLSDLVGSFDFVFDCGMMEAIFHTPNLLANLHAVLTIGGAVVHHVPSNNCVDRGFYQYSPTFFHEYYRVNNYTDIRIAFRRSAGELTMTTDYRPGLLNVRLDDAIYTTQCFARKTPVSTADRFPQKTFA